MYAAVQQTAANPYYLFDGYAHLAAGLACGLAGLAAGMAIGIVGDAGVRWSSMPDQLVWPLTAQLTRACPLSSVNKLTLLLIAGLMHSSQSFLLE